MPVRELVIRIAVPRLSRRVRALLAAGVVVIGATLAYAMLPNPSFMAGQVVSAKQITDNFTNLDARLSVLETFGATKDPPDWTGVPMGFVPTTHFIDLPAPGTYLLLYCASTNHSLAKRPDQLAVRLIWPGGAGNQRLITGMSGQTANTSGAVTMIEVITTLQANLRVRVEATDNGFGFMPNGSITLQDATLTYRRIK